MTSNISNNAPKTVHNGDESLLAKYKIKDNDNLNDYAMQPIKPNSLFIKNGVMYVLGGVSSGKSTLLSKLIAVYDKELNHPIILSCYSGLTPDETTTYALSNFGIHPMFIKLPTAEAMVSFFNQYRYKRLKLAELLMFLISVFNNDTKLLLDSVNLVEELSINTAKMLKDVDFNKRVQAMLLYVNELIISKKIIIQASKKHFIYLSEFITKTYAGKRKVKFDIDPAMFITHCLISFNKGFHESTVTVDILNEPTVKVNIKSTARGILNRFTPYTFKPFIRLVSSQELGTMKLELTPSITIFDDVAQFPLLTTERSNQWTKDLFAETRRWMNTFIIAAQRHNLLNKTLRSLTHTFFIGYSLVDDDIPKIAKEIPSNLLPSKEFIMMYTSIIKPFTFFVYNNKLGYNILTLRKN